MSSEQVLSVLETDKEKGLSEEEAKKRLEVYGENKLEEKAKKTWIQIFLEQLNNPMIFKLFLLYSYNSESSRNSDKFLLFFHSYFCPHLCV